MRAGYVVRAAWWSPPGAIEPRERARVRKMERAMDGTRLLLGLLGPAALLGPLGGPGNGLREG